MINFHIISIFPQVFDSYLNESILKRAQESKKISIKLYNPRDFTVSARGKKNPTYSDKRLDDKPYGGGPGMVLQAEPYARAISKAVSTIRRKKNSRVKIIFFAPHGAQVTTEYASKVVKKYTDIVLVCGRYEGIDARLHSMFSMEDISVGPFVLTGGELPAMIVIDTMSRQIQGVLGSFDSREEARIASPRVYTRPDTLVWKGKKFKVRKVLLSGDHKKIDAWRNGLRNKLSKGA